MKQIIFGDEARNKLIDGVNKLTKAVVTTLGPKGRNVAIDKNWGYPTVLHDGVSVSKEVELPDEFENMGAQLVKEVASKTNDQAGDGTTTATLLAQQIVIKGMKHIKGGLFRKGTNPMLMKKGIDKAVTVVVKELNRIKKEVKQSDWEKVATISAQNPMIGKKIAEALKIVGRDGVVTVEESKGMEFEIEHKQGMVFDKGFASSYFANDEGEATITNPYILITDNKIGSINELLPFLEATMKTTKDIVIISDTIDGEALTALVVNKMRGNLNVLAVNAPAFGDLRREMLKDIASLTGATFISEETGRKLDSVTIDDLGRADKVFSNKDETQIIGGKGDTEERVELITNQIKKTKGEYDKERLIERLAKISTGVAVIKVGATTETEMNEMKERVIDAVGATKAAIEEGIVTGGGVALIKASKVLKELKGENHDENIGIKIVLESLSEPLRWLAFNSGANPTKVIKEVEKNDNPNYGFNALTLEYEDLIKAGIIDPVKVTRCALQNAASVASMILTTDCLITDIKEKIKLEGV